MRRLSDPAVATLERSLGSSTTSPKDTTMTARKRRLLALLALALVAVAVPLALTSPLARHRFVPHYVRSD